MRLEVTHIVEADSDKLHRTVAAVGGTTADGAMWVLSMADAVEGMEQERWSFYIRGRFGQPIDLVIAEAPDGTRYLRSPNETKGPLMLLLLPRCKPLQYRLPMLEKTA